MHDVSCSYDHRRVVFNWPGGDYISFRVENLLRQQVVRQMLLLNLAGLNGAAQLPGNVVSPGRSANQNFFMREGRQDHLDCRDHVRVGGHDDSFVEAVLVGFLNELDDEVGIRAPLFPAYPVGLANHALHALFLEVPEDRSNTKHPECFDVFPVTNHGMWEPLGVGRKVKDFVEALFGWLDEGFGERSKVHPFKMIDAKTGDGVIEVEAVDIALHAIQYPS